MVKDHHLHACLEELMLSLYKHYTSRSMLNKLLAGLTTNDLESFNATLWNRIPKSKFHGQKRVETALMLCIIEHEDGKAGLLPVMFFLGTVSSEAGSVFEQQM